MRSLEGEALERFERLRVRYVSRETFGFLANRIRCLTEKLKFVRLGLPARESCQFSSAHLKCLLMISRNGVRGLLSPFDISISDERIDKLIVYVDLLLRWNRKINLTSISTVEECVTRHFGECFFVASLVELQGSLLDIGSGAGFPGLSLKLIAPLLNVVLLEPVGKKRAFLKEVARACELSPVQVMGDRLEEFARVEEGHRFDIVTARAVGGLASLVGTAIGLLAPGGQLCLWLGVQQVKGIQKANSDLKWAEPKPVPLSRDRVILVGVR